MSGFRVGYHSAQGHFGVMPDITCLGKVIGGGVPVGAYGGSKEIMESVAPTGKIYQAGTLSGNPIAMAAGYTSLSLLKPEHYEQFEKLGDQLEKGILRLSKAYDIPIQVNRAGSMIGMFFTDKPVINYQGSKASDTNLFSNYYREMINRGVFLPPSQFEGIFLSTEHTAEDIENTLKAMDESFAAIRR